MKSRIKTGLAGLSCVVIGTALLAGCQQAPSVTDSQIDSVDDGSIITMWTRSSTGDFTQLVVDAYNASHENQVELTVIPADQYLQKVGAAAGSGQLPDILGSNVVLVPDLIQKGLLLDISEPFHALDFADTVSPAQIEAVSADDEIYGVPHAVDVAALFYNKVLFEEAGLDSEAPPTTLTELSDYAHQIRDSGPDRYGFYFGGNCGGCMLFGSWPSIWTSGGEVLNSEGTESVLDDTAADVYSVYAELFASGVVPADARNETGATNVSVFQSGTIGMQPLGATAIASLSPNERLEVGVAPLPGLDDATPVSFLGGDSIGISSNSENASAAFDFLAWSLGDEAQQDVVIGNGYLTPRIDLVDAGAEGDPMAQLNSLVADARTPRAVQFGTAYNDPNGPWLSSVRSAIFDGDPTSALNKGNDAITAALTR